MISSTFPGAVWESTSWAGLVPVKVRGELSGRRLEARIQAERGETVVWKCPVVKGSIGVVNGLGVPLRVSVDGRETATVPAGRTKWIDGLAVGDHDVRVQASGAPRDARKTMRVLPGRKAKWEVR